MLGNLEPAWPLYQIKTIIPSYLAPRSFRLDPLKHGPIHNPKDIIALNLIRTSQSSLLKPRRRRRLLSIHTLQSLHSLHGLP